MQDLTRAQKARVAIRSFQTIAHALALRGFFRPSGRMGESLAECLETLSPEIYGSMNDPRVVELKGLEYVIDRLPRGIEACTRIILTEEEQFERSSFEKLVPLKRRRSCYRISDREICLVVTRGLSEIYDILTHLTFLNVEARKIRKRMRDETGNITVEWLELEKIMERIDELGDRKLEQALWVLSLILGRPYQQTLETYEYFEKNKQDHQSNNGFFSLIYHLGKRVDEENIARENAMVIYLTPSMMNIIGHQKYGGQWADDIKARLRQLDLDHRPLHIISANLHSVINLLYGYAAIKADRRGGPGEGLIELVHLVRNRREVVMNFARQHGMYELPDRSGTHIDCQIIDTACLAAVPFHPELKVAIPEDSGARPVILVMDYAFGMQAFEVMDNLLNPYPGEAAKPVNVHSISIMGKAGILPGKKGDIMLATAHVVEGSSDNYLFDNDLNREDFGNDDEIEIFTGPMVTVVGTSLQNRDMLKKFQSSWHTVGLEMEGAHYQRAIGAAMIKGHLSREARVRYAYYASDNPLVSGQTLAAGEMGAEGVKPTYMVTQVILEKILPKSCENAGLAQEISPEEKTGPVSV